MPYTGPMHALHRTVVDRLVQLRLILSQTAHVRLGGVTAEAWALAGNPIAGSCPVCGTQRALFSDFTENLRESGACSACGASNRQRQMALALRRTRDLAPVGRLTLPEGCRLYSAEANGPLHAALTDLPGYVCSEYLGEAHTPGASVNGVRHENLERLSFADETIDVMLSSDVLEHVADAYRAHRDIFRVLRRGGLHIFTVPFVPGAADDDVRARRVDGEIEYLAAPLYHGDPVRPDQGILVWRIFGAAMLTRLQEIGFSTTTMRLHEPRHGIIGDNGLVFVARKP
ncbi:MAG: methyltransferase domain-containing protein [Acetobacteraceae bacterium]